MYETDDRDQIATYFAPLSVDSYGHTTFDEPVTVLCRWSDQINVISDAQGKQITTGVVVSPVSLVAVNGRMALGEFDTDDEALAASRIIKSVAVSRALDEELYMIKAWLQ